MSDTKYTIDSEGVILLFANPLNHRKMAGGKKVKSAGFFRIVLDSEESEGFKVETWGKSESLDIGIKEGDPAKIKNFLLHKNIVDGKRNQFAINEYGKATLFSAKFSVDNLKNRDSQNIKEFGAFEIYVDNKYTRGLSVNLYDKDDNQIDNESYNDSLRSLLFEIPTYLL